MFKEVGLDPTQGTGKMAADLYSGKLDSIQDQMEHPVGQHLQEMQRMEISGHM